MTQNNMLPAYTKVNQAKLFFILLHDFPRTDSMMYLVNIVTHVQMNWNFAFIWHK